MKRILIYMALATVLAAGAGCSRAKNISPGELKEIFKDAFLVNAYYQYNPDIMRSVAVDSLDIYRPILKRHGYTLRDLEYTIQQISKQKSQKLSDIMELSIEELKKEAGALDQRVAALDSIDARASRVFMRTVLFEERVKAGDVKDTAKLRITLPVDEGIYELSYSYLVDSLEQNGGLRVTGTMIDTLGRRRSVFSQPLIKKNRQSPAPHRFETTAADSALVLMLGNYTKTMGRPDLTVDSLRLVHFPPGKKAVDSAMKMVYNIEFPIWYGEEKSAAQDSGALRPDAAGIDTPRVGDARR